MAPAPADEARRAIASLMNPVRVLATATAMELSAAVALLAVGGLFGFRSGWLDVINNLAPVLIAIALVGAALAILTLDRGPVRLVTLALSGLGAVYGLAIMAPDVIQSFQSHHAKGTALKVLSTNVWSGNPTPDAAISTILARDADVVLMQETNGNVSASLARLKVRYPYSSDCNGQGVQIFAKTPLIDRGCGRDSDAPGLLDQAWVETTAPDGRPVTLLTTHLNWPFPPRSQPFQRQLLLETIQHLPGDVILAGDFNTTPWSFAMRRQDAMLAPLTRRTHGLFSWPARINAIRRPWTPMAPIDHLYCGPNWTANRVSSFRMPGSDHFAIETVLVRR